MSHKMELQGEGEYETSTEAFNLCVKQKVTVRLTFIAGLISSLGLLRACIFVSPVLMYTSVVLLFPSNMKSVSQRRVGRHRTSANYISRC